MNNLSNIIEVIYYFNYLEGMKMKKFIMVSVLVMLVLGLLSVRDKEIVQAYPKL